MRCQKARRALATLLLVPAVSVFAEEPPVLRVALEEPRPAEKNRFGLSYRMSFNITAQFRNVGSLGRGPGGRGGPGPATGRGIDRNYDDGYNRTDSDGGDDGLTWNWAYRNDSQIVNDTVVMHSRSAQSIDSGTWDNDPQHGFELTYNRELGILERTGWHWGVEGAFGWTDIDIKDRRPLAGGVREIADAYNLGVDPSRNQIPPGANTPPPYEEEGRQFNPGTFNGPGSLIGVIPDRTVTFDRNGALVTGSRRLDAHLWTYRLGPYLDIPIDDRWTFTFSAGVIVGVVEGEFTFRQAVRTGGATTFQSGSGSNTDVVWGGYLSALFRYAIDENWGVFVGGQYLGLTCYEAEERGQKVEIDFARTANATMGVSFSF